MDSPRLTDVEMEMFARQKRENRRAIITLIALVGGLSGLAIALASMSRSSRDEDHATTSDKKTTGHASLEAPTTSAAAASPSTPAPEAATERAQGPSADDLRRMVREQKQSSVMACIEHAGKRASRKAKVTVKLDLTAPDHISKLEVTTTPKNTRIANCVKGELKGLVLPRLASNMTVSVPFNVGTAHGRRPHR